MILDSPAAMFKGPAPDYEMARRQLRRDVDELRLLAEATLRRSSRLAGLVEKYSEDMKAALARLDRDDGWHKWRVDESLRLTHLAQDRILKTQNPPNCKKAKKLVCHLNYACGFGCQAIRIKLILIKFHHALCYILCIFFRFITRPTVLPQRLQRSALLSFHPSTGNTQSDFLNLIFKIQT